VETISYRVPHADASGEIEHWIDLTDSVNEYLRAPNSYSRRWKKIWPFLNVSRPSNTGLGYVPFKRRSASPETRRVTVERKSGAV